MVKCAQFWVGTRNGAGEVLRFHHLIGGCGEVIPASLLLCSVNNLGVVVALFFIEHELFPKLTACSVFH